MSFTQLDLNLTKYTTHGDRCCRQTPQNRKQFNTVNKNENPRLQRRNYRTLKLLERYQHGHFHGKTGYHSKINRVIHRKMSPCDTNNLHSTLLKMIVNSRLIAQLSAVSCAENFKQLKISKSLKFIISRVIEYDVIEKTSTRRQIVIPCTVVEKYDASM